MELQVDLFLPARIQLVGFSMAEDQHKENSPPFLEGRLSTSFPAQHYFKRQPLQEITHLFASNTNTQSIHNGRRMFSVVEMRALVEQTSNIRNKKRKSTNMSSDSNTSISNVRRPLLRRDFR